jgi:ribosomal protein S18 acetylase RimI-like enzyme
MGQTEAISTRLARLDDIPTMVRISADVWDGDDYIPRVARQWVCDPQGRFIVAECDGVVRGFGRLAMRTPADGWLEGLRVDSSFRRHGVARVIARRLLEEAKDAGAKSLRFATACDNIESIALNESLGFVRIGGFRHFYCDPEPLPAVIQAAKSRADELAAQRHVGVAGIEVARVHSPGPGDTFTKAIQGSTTVAGARGMLPAGFVFYPASAHSIAEMAKRGCAFTAHDGDGRRAVLLMDTSSEMWPEAGELVISVLEGDYTLCWAVLSYALREMSGHGMRSVSGCVPCGGMVASMLTEIGFEMWHEDIPPDMPTVLLYELLPELQGKI